MLLISGGDITKVKTWDSLGKCFQLPSRPAKTFSNQKCRPMPNVMVALPNAGDALYSTPPSLADDHYYMPWSNAAKTRNQLKSGGVPQINETISAANGPKFTLRPVLSASRVQHASDLHPKFALATPCVEVGLWYTSNLRRLRLGEERKKDK